MSYQKVLCELGGVRFNPACKTGIFTAKTAKITKRVQHGNASRAGLPGSGAGTARPRFEVGSLRRRAVATPMPLRMGTFDTKMVKIAKGVQHGNPSCAWRASGQ